MAAQELELGSEKDWLEAQKYRLLVGLRLEPEFVLAKPPKEDLVLDLLRMARLKKLREEPAQFYSSLATE